jgi:hypothetical protein
MADRPKGYMNWNPKQESLDLLATVKAVLREERAELPVTSRYLFYVLVGKHGFPKTENDYGRLCNLLVKARRAQLIPFSAIRDDGANAQGGSFGYDDPADFWQRLQESGEGYTRYTRLDQELYVELWSEGNSPVPMLARAARRYGVKVTGTGGFPGVTLTHNFARRVVQREEPTVWLHIGDYDPSGESIYESMRQDIWAFVAGEIGADEADHKFRPERIGLTEDQVEKHGIETAPPKKSDGRSAKWEGEGRFESAQLEAVPASLLKEWVGEACERHTDMEILEEHERNGDEERGQIEATLEKLTDGGMLE